ncbi:MAG: glycosyltransferase family 4 protein [Planctomycetota bacterium]
MAGAIRTLHINTERTFRGGERQVLALARGLVERGHAAELVAQPDGELARRAAEVGIEVHRVKVRHELDPLAVARLCSLLRDGDYEIVHMHTGRAHTLGTAASMLAGAGARIVSRRVVSPAGRNWLGRFKYRHWVDRYIAISEAVKRVLVEGGVAPGRVAVVPSCVDVERFQNAADRSAEFCGELGIAERVPVVGSVGALTPPKGFAHLLEAIPLVRERVPEARFVLVGDGELRAELEQQAAQLGLGPDALTFFGRRDDVPELLRFFDLFVSSSIAEGLGTAAIQALASGTPAVVTDAGGLPEVVDDGETGLVVEAGSGRALADAIVRLLRDAGLRARMASLGPERARDRFSPGQMVDGTLAVYREALESRTRR